MSIQMVKPTVISTFAGCGGSSLGYKLAGFRELLAIDFEKNAVDTFRLNFPGIDCWQRDISTVTGDEIFTHCNIKKGDLDVFDGSPPCQGFSTAGKRNIVDSRNDLFKHYIRLVNELQPKIFVMENVSGMIKGTMKGRFIEIMIQLKNTGYNVKCKSLNSANYSVAQARNRLFFIGVRPDLNKEPVFPITKHKILTSGEMISNITNSDEELKQSYITNKVIKDNYEFIPKGKTGESISKGSYFNTIRLNDRKPSPTITKTRGLLHFNEKRYLTIKEVKRLCSFPDDFILVGSVYNQWARLGNAVMPNQMKAIAETLKTEILENI